MMKIFSLVFLTVCFLQDVDGEGCVKPCQQDECCVSVYAPFITSKRALPLLPYNGLHGDHKIHYCGKMKQAGERCLVNNKAGTWCDCKTGYTCVKSADTNALHAFYGTCEKV